MTEINDREKLSFLSGYFLSMRTIQEISKIKNINTVKSGEELDINERQLLSSVIREVIKISEKLEIEILESEKIAIFNELVLFSHKIGVAVKDEQ